MLNQEAESTERRQCSRLSTSPAVIHKLVHELCGLGGGSIVVGAPGHEQPGTSWHSCRTSVSTATRPAYGLTQPPGVLERNQKIELYRQYGVER